MINFLLTFSLMAFSAEDSKLVKAVHDGSVAQVKSLAKIRTELNWKDSGGFDALYYAVSLNDFGKAQALLQAGAFTKNLYSNKKESLLFEAVRLGSREMLDLLIKNDSSLLKIKNMDDENLIFEAVRANQSVLVQHLMKKGLSLNEKNKAGKIAADFVDPKNKDMTVLFKK